MATGYKRPSTPADVERRLRQEAGFGCAKCGHPYLEYHHIVPYSEEAHFRAEDMVALCGNCHPAVSKLERDRQYEIKGKPVNIDKGLFKGALEYDKRDLIFRVGGNWYENIPVILQFYETPIIACSLMDGQAKVTLNILDQAGSPMLQVVENVVHFRINDLWDFEYAHNLAIARFGPRDIALRIDFRKPEAIIEGRLWLGTWQVRLSSEESIFPGNNVMRGNRIADGLVGIQIGATGG